MTDIQTLVPGFQTALERIPGTFSAYRNLAKALEHATMPQRIRAQIALVVAQQVRCDYCLWALGRMAEHQGLNAEDIVFARAGTARNRREAAIVKLAYLMVSNGELRERIECDPSYARVFGETEIAEVLAHVAFSVLTCYILQTLAPRARSGASQTRPAN